MDFGPTSLEPSAAFPLIGLLSRPGAASDTVSNTLIKPFGVLQINRESWQNVSLLISLLTSIKARQGETRRSGAGDMAPKDTGSLTSHAAQLSTGLLQHSHVKINCSSVYWRKSPRAEPDRSASRTPKPRENKGSCSYETFLTRQHRFSASASSVFTTPRTPRGEPITERSSPSWCALAATALEATGSANVFLHQEEY